MAWRLEDFTLPHIEMDLSRVLANEGFNLFKKGQWVRYWGWKSDHIYVTVDTKSAFSFNCQVWAAPWPENDELGVDRSFDCATLPWMLGKPDGEFKVPHISMFIPAFRTEIVHAVETKAVKWFDRCNTPSACLAVLRTRPYENLDSPAFKHLVRYVAFLPTDLENIACLFDPPAPITDSYQRTLFIPQSRRKTASPSSL